MKKRNLFKMSCFTIGVFLALGSLFVGNAFTAELPTTLKYGVLAAMTGAQAKWGEWGMQGVNLAVDEINSKGGINGKKIEVVTGDDRFQPSQAVTLAQKMVTQDNILVCKTMGVPCSLAVNPICEKNKVVQLTNSYGPSVTQRGSKYVFRICPNAEAQNISVIDYMVRERGTKEFGVIRDSGEYGESNTKAYIKALELHGLKPLAVEVFNLGDKDFTGQLLKIKNAGAKALILSTTDVDSAAILRQVRMMNLPFQPVGNASQATGLMVKILGPYIEGLTFSGFDDYLTSKVPRIVEVREKFQKKYGQLPGSFICLDEYDGIQLFKTALERAWPNITAEGLRDAFASISTKAPNAKGPYQGIFHKFDYDETGEGVTKVKIWQFGKKGEILLLKD